MEVIAKIILTLYVVITSIPRVVKKIVAVEKTDDEEEHIKYTAYAIETTKLLVNIVFILSLTYIIWRML